MKRNTKIPFAGVVVSIRLTEDQHARLKAEALRETRSVSQQVRHMIAQLEQGEEHRGNGAHVDHA